LASLLGFIRAGVKNGCLSAGLAASFHSLPGAGSLQASKQAAVADLAGHGKW
jgi:hypothetical protein